MVRSYLLSYHNDCVIISRPHLPPKRGGRMHCAGCAIKTYAPPPRPFSASLRRHENPSASLTSHSSLITHHFLIGCAAI